MFSKLFDFLDRNVRSKTFKLFVGTVLGAVSGALLDRSSWSTATILIVQAFGMLFLHDQNERAKAVN